MFIEKESAPNTTLAYISRVFDSVAKLANVHICLQSLFGDYQLLHGVVSINIFVVFAVARQFRFELESGPVNVHPAHYPALTGRA
jgi:hypothetical protein